METISVKIGKRFAVVLPPRFRGELDAEEGGQLVMESVDGGVMIRPAAVVPVRKYSRMEKAQFLLENATDAADYREAVASVEAMGLNPKAVPHRKPKGVK